MKNKIGLIIKREYTTRVRNRSFILSTILLPLFFIGFIFASAYFSIESIEQQRIAVDDQSGDFRNTLKNDDHITFDFTTDITPRNFAENGYSAYLYIPSHYASTKDSLKLVSAKQLGISTEEKIKNEIDEALRNRALLHHNIDKRLLDSINNVQSDELYHFSSVIRLMSVFPMASVSEVVS